LVRDIDLQGQRADPEVLPNVPGADGFPAILDGGKPLIKSEDVAHNLRRGWLPENKTCINPVDFREQRLDDLYVFHGGHDVAKEASRWLRGQRLKDLR
jgi:hypothetical protein